MTTTAHQRQLMAQAMDLLVQNRDKVAYLERRPMGTRGISTIADLAHALAGLGIECDCSESATLIAHVAGLLNPSGFTYASGAGDTQTMYDHLPHYTNPAAAEVGAFVFFGDPGLLSTQHMCVVRKPGDDPGLFSHGGNGAYAAHWTLLSQERLFHVGTPVFLSIAHLG